MRERLQVQLVELQVVVLVGLQVRLGLVGKSGSLVQAGMIVVAFVIGFSAECGVVFAGAVATSANALALRGMMLRAETVVAELLIVCSCDSIFSDGDEHCRWLWLGDLECLDHLERLEVSARLFCSLDVSLFLVDDEEGRVRNVSVLTVAVAGSSDQRCLGGLSSGGVTEDSRWIWIGIFFRFKCADDTGLKYI
ncbi:unnamed protein product [Notodromas monacha]|uniref:Uncharacterized protein n=1 Tax=Notodromas monacha TaxID=399045 RepID=A0A7R9BVH4_9CRUS|nr:unnamed protein product [Notodromas monacha]CAG0920982.1 unnamed protein product [Notodromas monacha]